MKDYITRPCTSEATREHARTRAIGSMSERQVPHGVARKPALQPTCRDRGSRKRKTGVRILPGLLSYA